MKKEQKSIFKNGITRLDLVHILMQKNSIGKVKGKSNNISSYQQNIYYAIFNEDAKGKRENILKMHGSYDLECLRALKTAIEAIEEQK